MECDRKYIDFQLNFNHIASQSRLASAPNKQRQRKSPFNRKKPGIGPGSYRENPSADGWLGKEGRRGERERGGEQVDAS